MLSKKAKYGLQAAFYLADNYLQGTVLISDIAKIEALPRKFLETILLELNKKGILRSQKGKGGGYSLKRSPKDITCGEIIRVLEGPLAPVPCVSQTAYSPCDDCASEVSCSVRMVMKEVRDAMANILDNKSLWDVVNEKRQKKMLQLSYEI